MNNPEQQFLIALDDKLWKSANKLRANLGAANYKHVVLSLIFLKYVSDAFEERREELLELFKIDSDDNIYYMRLLRLSWLWGRPKPYQIIGHDKTARSYTKGIDSELDITFSVQLTRKRHEQTY